MAGSKRKRTAKAASTSKSKSSSNKNNNKKTMFSKKKKNSIHDIFTSLCEDSNDPKNSVINMEGIASMGEKLDIDVTEDIRILVLLWKLDCGQQKPGCITFTEWNTGCEKHNLDSWDAFTKFLPQLDTGFLENHEFKDFYKFCFKFNLSGTHRTLDKEVVSALLPMVLADSNHRVPANRLTSFCTFLEQETKYTKNTLDQWTSFLDFCHEVPDLSNYDESTSAWPVMLDEYVDYMMDNEKQQHNNKKK